MINNMQADIAATNRVINNENEVYNRIKGAGSSSAQLKKAAIEFESIFVTQMLEKLDNTVDKEGGIFENSGEYMKNFKSLVFQQMGRDVANNPNNSFGLAKQIYNAMKVALPAAEQSEWEG